MLDEDYMRLALRLARRGLGKVSPNPMVGAVIVKDNRLIGQGYHRRYGDKHAEINAIEATTESVAGATLYVTLEPCRHYGKTPPCTDALIRSRIGRVLIGTLDPNPLMRGKSVELLQQHGIESKVGVLEDECCALNEAHFKLMTTSTPLVTLKFAQTLDGRIATASGSSRWISSEKFRRLVHKLRATHDAIIVGVGTIIADDPQLTVRLVKGRNPIRIVLDATLRIPLEAMVLQNQELTPTIVATTSRADGQKLSRLRTTGIEIMSTPEDDQGEVNLKHLLSALGKRNISSVLVEGGSSVITSFLRQGLVDKLVTAVAPKILGKGIETVGELGISNISQSLKLSYQRVFRLGEDVVIEANFKPEH